MKNIAKCKACESIIESLCLNDEVSCKCGQISVYGGINMGCSAIKWENFLRIDDEGNTIVPTIREKTMKESLLDSLDEMIKKIEEMPPNAMIISINHYDFASLLMLLSAIFRSDSSSKI